MDCVQIEVMTWTTQLDLVGYILYIIYNSVISWINLKEITQQEILVESYIVLYI